VLPELLEEVPVEDATGGSVDEGDELFMQELSSDMPTVCVSELPPCRPLESMMMKITSVPFQISAVQSYESSVLVGGERVKLSPPGMTP